MMSSHSRSYPIPLIETRIKLAERVNFCFNKKYGLILEKINKLLQDFELYGPKDSDVIESTEKLYSSIINAIGGGVIPLDLTVEEKQYYPDLEEKIKTTQDHLDHVENFLLPIIAGILMIPYDEVSFLTMEKDEYLKVSENVKKLLVLPDRKKSAKGFRDILKLT